jgi:CTP:molybdopterin cytidylyltransferase MocA
MPMKTIAAIIVAAGSSSRLGQPKQLVMIEGEPMLQRAIRFVRAAGASPVFVVLGANRQVIESRVDFADATIIVNDDWAEGMASSIRAGVSTAEKEATDASGLLLMVCDQPRVTTEYLRSLICTFAVQQGQTAIASVYAGARGIPAIFPREAIADLYALRGDTGARRLLAQPPWPVIEMPLEGGEMDIDRPEDLDQLG